MTVAGQTLFKMVAILDRKPMPRTTDRSAFNQAVDANRPTESRYRTFERGRFLTQRDLRRIRYWEAIANSQTTRNLK